MIDTIRTMTRAQKNAILAAVILALCAGFVVGYAACSVVQREVSHIDKVNFCHDRMKNDAIRYVWRQQYCGKVKIEAIDPITGKPVMGIVEGE